jgi:hypothetical protein
MVEMPERDFEGSRDAAIKALADIKATLPAELQARALSRRAKIPFKVALYRDSLLWRIDELGHAALAAYDQPHHVAAILITRGVMESVAALNSLRHLVTTYRGGNPETLDDTLMRMLLGSRVRADRPDAINILNAVDRLSKVVPTFRRLYDQLSEFAHPNDAGTAASFARINSRGTYASFGQLGEDAARRAWLLIECLSTSLMLVRPLYDEIVVRFAPFIAQCEADVADI